jgi:uncharacterized membrane protein YkvA (DUF1232 family)
MSKKPTRNEITSQALLMEAAAKVGDAEVKQILKNKKNLEAKAKQGVLAQFFDDIRTMFSMVRDFSKREYRKVPFGTIAAVAGALLYILSPVDLIPDFIPGIGLMDDVGVLLACLRLVRVDLQKYRLWKDRE